MPMRDMLRKIIFRNLHVPWHRRQSAEQQVSPQQQQTRKKISEF